MVLNWYFSLRLLHGTVLDEESTGLCSLGQLDKRWQKRFKNLWTGDFCGKAMVL